jgi:transposase
MRAYHPDLRERIVQAHHNGLHHNDIAYTYQVSHRTIERYVKRQRETGSLKPSPIPGRPRRLNLSKIEQFKAQLQTQPDASLEQHQHLWQTAHQQTLSLATISRTITRLGWTRKKDVPRQ